MDKGWTRDVDAFHREHARVELAIRDLKEGAGLEHVPSEHFFANAARLICAVLAHDLIRWTAMLGDTWVESRSSIPPNAQRSLRSPEWIARRENLVVAGPSGIG